MDVTACTDLVKVDLVVLGDEFLDAAEQVPAVRVDVTAHPQAMVAAGLEDLSGRAEEAPDADGFVYLQDCSACTGIPAAVGDQQLARIATAMATWADRRLRAGHAPSRIVEALSWATSEATSPEAIDRLVPGPL